MVKQTFFKKLIQAFNANGQEFYTDNKTFIWYREVQHANKDWFLHFEIVDGGHAEQPKKWYKENMIYVELHFEPEDGTEDEAHEIEFFDSRLKDIKGPYQYISEWKSKCGSKKIGFALRYKWDEQGGVPYSDESNVEEIKKSVVSHMTEFIERLNPRIEKISKQFEEEKNMKTIEDWVEELKTAKQIILTGAPGTGKTYLARQIAQQMILGRVVDDEKELSKDEQYKLHNQLVMSQSLGWRRGLLGYFAPST